MKYVLYAFLVYLAYQFIFRLVIPVYKTSRKIKKGFMEMQEKMQQQSQEQQKAQTSSSESSKTTRAPAGDYIDFIEIK